MFEIDSNADNHNLKAFFKVLTQKSRDQVPAPGSAEGYFYEDGGVINSAFSGSFGERMMTFKSGSAYTTDPVTFTGLLSHDLSDTGDMGIPMGVEVKILLHRAPMGKIIHTLDGTSQNQGVSKGTYKLEIVSLHAHCPVAYYSSDSFNYYDHHIKKEVAKLRFRRLVLKTVTVPQSTMNFESNPLFGLSEVAARMNVFLQGVDHYNNGNIQGAFFKFDYIWKKDDILDVVNNQRRDDNMSPTQNSTATAEPSAETSSEPSAEPSIISSSFRNAVRRWFPNTFAQQDIERANPEIIRPIQDYVPPIPSQYRGANDDVYVQSQQLYLNGRVMQSLSLDQNTPTRAVNDYYSFCLQTGCVQTGFSHGISLNSFMKAYWNAAYDLTGSASAYNLYYSPNSRVGFFRFCANFSGPIHRPLMALFFLEYSSTLAFARDGSITRSYSV